MDVDETPTTEQPADPAGAVTDAEIEAARSTKPLAEGDDPRDFRRLAATLLSLSTSKQISVLELWPAVEVEIDEGLTISAKSKKELRRFTRDKDIAMIAWLKSFEPGEVFYDIGANCGSLSLIAGAMHRDQLQIVAIEPTYGSFESMTRNLSRNKLLSQVIPLQVGLLDRTGLQAMNYHNSTDAGTSLHAVGTAVDHEGKPFEPVEVQMIPVFALDDLIDTLGLPLPTRVKIDVDGFEEQVLDGAHKTLARRSIRELAVEIVDYDRAGTRIETIKQQMEANGYELVDVFKHHGDDSFVSDHLFRRRDQHGLLSRLGRKR